MKIRIEESPKKTVFLKQEELVDTSKKKIRFDQIGKNFSRKVHEQKRNEGQIHAKAATLQAVLRFTGETHPCVFSTTNSNLDKRKFMELCNKTRQQSSLKKKRQCCRIYVGFVNKEWCLLRNKLKLHSFTSFWDRFVQFKTISSVHVNRSTDNFNFVLALKVVSLVEKLFVASTSRCAFLFFFFNNFSQLSVIELTLKSWTAFSKKVKVEVWMFEIQV